MYSYIGESQIVLLWQNLTSYSKNLAVSLALASIKHATVPDTSNEAAQANES